MKKKKNAFFGKKSNKNNRFYRVCYGHRTFIILLLCIDRIGNVNISHIFNFWRKKNQNKCSV